MHTLHEEIQPLSADFMAYYAAGTRNLDIKAQDKSESLSIFRQRGYSVPGGSRLFPLFMMFSNDHISHINTY